MGQFQIRHGHNRKDSRTKIYGVWAAMKSRCTNPNSQDYHRYGGRGITICEDWLDFENFLRDMGDNPEGLTLDRVDNDLGYFKDNCIWKSRGDQANNTRRNKVLTYNGKSMTQAQWARETGLSTSIIDQRLRILGWELGRTLTTPSRQSKKQT